ncbi:MAG: hypothetical protein RR053_06845 [Evtepia sp.]
MDQLSFQNGFLCGMATRGLTKSGDFYKPACYNDNEQYSYFYLDFKRTLSDFSTGMLSESIVVMGQTQLAIQKSQLVSPGVYQLFCNLSGCIHGVTIFNNPNTLLTFSNGEKVPLFSSYFLVSGMTSYIGLEYIYEKAKVKYPAQNRATETHDVQLTSSMTLATVYDRATNLYQADKITSENFAVILV